MLLVNSFSKTSFCIDELRNNPYLEFELKTLSPIKLKVEFVKPEKNDFLISYKTTTTNGLQLQEIAKANDIKFAELMRQIEAAFLRSNDEKQ